MNDTAFDDDGNRIGQTGFDYDAMDGTQEPQDRDDARARQELFRRVIQFLASGEAPAVAVGRRVILLAHLLHDNAVTQRQLARKLRLSPGRVSQLLNVVKRELATLAKD
ncbi:MAG: helix-turn-helix domain-containing protein [Verrucomicrobiota bacterium]